MKTPKIISEMLGIPVTTLKYWERAGLIDVPRSENNYRNYHSGHVSYLHSLNYYKTHIGISNKNLKYLNTGKMEDIAVMLDIGEKELKSKIKKLTKQLDNLLQEKQKYANNENNKKRGYFFSEIPFDFLVKRNDFSLAEIFQPQNFDRTFILFTDDFIQKLKNNEKPLGKNILYLGKNKSEMQKNWTTFQLDKDSKIIECFLFDKEYPHYETNAVKIINDIIGFGFEIKSFFVNCTFISNFQSVSMHAHYRCFIEVTGSGTLPDTLLCRINRLIKR